MRRFYYAQNRPDKRRRLSARRLVLQPGGGLGAGPDHAPGPQRPRRRLHRLGEAAGGVRPGGVCPHPGRCGEDPLRLPGAGGSGDRRVLSGGPGRHRTHGLRRSQAGPERAGDLLRRERPVHRRAVRAHRLFKGQGLLRQRHLQVRHHHRTRRGLPLLPGGLGEEVRPGGCPGADLRHHGQGPGRPEVPGGQRGMGDLRGPRRRGRPIQRVDRRGPAAHCRGRGGYHRPDAGSGGDDGDLHRGFLPVPCLAVRRHPVRAVPGGPVH